MIETEFSESFDKLFQHIYRKNAEAIQLSHKLLEIAHTWDDLVDGDKPVPPKAVNNAFRGAIFEVQTSPLWINCGLNHHILNCYLRWRDATNIENSRHKTIDDLNKCYMLRAGLYDLFVIIAFYLYGDEWAEEIGPLVRRHYGETLEDYLKEMNHA